MLTRPVRGVVCGVAMIALAAACAQPPDEPAAGPDLPAEPELVVRTVSDPRWFDFSHDGRLLFLADFGWRVQVWDTERLELLAAYDLPRTSFVEPVVASKALILAYADYGDYTLHICNAATGEELLAFSPADRCLRTLALSPDGRTLASGSYRHRSDVRLWDTSTGKETDIIHGGRGASCAAVAAVDDEWAVLGYSDAAVRLQEIGIRTWDLRPSPEGSRNSIGDSLSHKGRSTTVTSVAIAEDICAACGPACGLYVWHKKSHKSVELMAPRGSRLHPTDPRLVALSATNQQLAVARLNGTVRVWDLTTNIDVGGWEWPHGTPHPRGHVRALRYTEDDRLVAAGVADGVVGVWTPALEKTPRALAPTATPHGMRPVGVGFPTGGRLTTIHVRETGWGSTRSCFGWPPSDRPGPATVSRATWFPTGATVEQTGCEIGCDEGYLVHGPSMALLTCGLPLKPTDVCQAHSLRDGSVNATLPVGGPMILKRGQMDASGRTLAVRDSRRVQIIRVSDGAELASFHFDRSDLGWVQAIAISGDGSTVAAHCGDILILNAATGAETMRIADPAVGGANHIALSPSGDRLAVEHYKGIHFYDTASGQGYVGWHRARVSRVMLCFSPDGRFLASGAADGQVTVWNAADGSVLSDMPAHDDRVTSLAFAPNGTSIVSAGRDGRIVVADIPTGKRIADLLLVSGPGIEGAGWLVITPDGHFDGSPDAIKACIRFRAGLEFRRARAFADRHVRGLLATVLADLSPN